MLLLLCGSAVADPERDAFERAKPAFETYCAKCHTKTGKSASAKKLDHFDMSSYPFGGHHAAHMGPTIRKVLGMTGTRPTMPADRKGAVKGDDLARIRAWCDAWDAAHVKR